MTGDSTNQIQQITDTALNAVFSLLGARSGSLKRKKKRKKEKGKDCFSLWKPPSRSVFYSAWWSCGKGHRGWMRTSSKCYITVSEEFEKKKKRELITADSVECVPN